MTVSCISIPICQKIVIELKWSWVSSYNLNEGNKVWAKNFVRAANFLCCVVLPTVREQKQKFYSNPYSKLVSPKFDNY